MAAAIAPNTPSGATYITYVTILSTTWARESSAFIIGSPFFPIAVSATPKNTEKTTNCKISFVAIASTTLRGTTCSTNFCIEKPLDFSNSSFTALKSVLVISTPTPGLKILTRINPRLSDTSDAVINHNIALPPTLPTVFISPSLAIPTTRVANTMGAMII